MREMKDSNQKWLGEIPYNWEIAKIDDLYSIRNTKVSDYEYEPLSVTMNGIVHQLESAAKTNAHDDRKLVKKGDFVINSRSDRRGSCGISDFDGSVSLINTVLKPKESMNPGFYNWLFHTFAFADEFYRCGHGIVDDLWTTNWQDMRKINIPVPCPEEQLAIASFLDSKCSEIDSITTDIQKEIETLQEYRKSVITEAVTKGLNPNVEMKDSGVEWLGEIPKHWGITKIKYSNRVKTDKVGLEKKELDYIALENVSNWTAKYIQTENDYEIKDSIICKKGDVILGKLRPYLAKGLIIENDCCCSSEFAVFARPTCPKFLMYYLLTPSVITAIDNSTYGTKMPRANVNDIMNLPYPYPSVDEQFDISTFFDSKCSEIDSIISDKQHQLEVLTEYRKSLIYEYVTGKKEVL